MNAQEMWREYSVKEAVVAEYDTWRFGDDADVLAQLVLQGIKTATASAYCLYQLDGEPIPQAGQYSVILNSMDEAVCVIRTQAVFVIPFDQVSDRQAWKEGEGDRSLIYWHNIHERFFRQELSAYGLPFDPKMLVVCEEFYKVYP